MKTSKILTLELLDKTIATKFYPAKAQRKSIVLSNEERNLSSIPRIRSE